MIWMDGEGILKQAKIEDNIDAAIKVLLELEAVENVMVLIEKVTL